MQTTPDWYIWFTMVQTLCMAVVAVVVFTLRLGSKGGQLLRVPEQLAKDVAELKADTERRFDHGNKEMSRLASQMQQVVLLRAQLDQHHETLRNLDSDYLTRREYLISSGESRDERLRLQREIEQLRAELRPFRGGGIEPA
jgi:hypothetical protein